MYLNYRKVAKISNQLELLKLTYDLDLYDIGRIRDLAYKEGYLELYQIITENPTKYIYDILHNFE